MELCLVKESVQVQRTHRALWRTTKYNAFIKELEKDLQKRSNSDGASRDSAISEDDDLRTVFLLSNVPVSISSTCEEINDHSERFAQRVEKKLTKDKSYGFDGIELELITSSDANSKDNYFCVYGMPSDGTKFDVFERLGEELGIDEAAEYRVELSFCHLPDKNLPISPNSMLVLKGNAGQRILDQIPPELNTWADENTGFIYSKVSVWVTLNDKKVNHVYRYLDTNESLLKDGNFADVTIRCQNGEIVKCHRAVLANKCETFRRMFVEIMQEAERPAEHMELQMNTSQKGVEAFLGYLYCGRVDSGLNNSTDALELLSAARHYAIVGLEQAMDEIITAKTNSDFGYFSVEGALDLFLLTRNLVELKHLRDKAVMVLKSYLKTKSDVVMESRKYQEFFQSQQKIAMELSLLYIRLT